MNKIWTEDRLNSLLAAPSQVLIDDIKKIQGDITVLGASGKMGPTLCMLAQNAVNIAKINKKIIAVARFSDKKAESLLKDNGIETISCDLADTEQLKKLPLTENVIYMAGRKFGTDGNEWMTWAMNGTVPAFVIDKYKAVNYVVFSTANVYPYTKPCTGGNNEEVHPSPLGEYAMSCMARERAFEYAANTYGANVFMYRLCYAVDLRYGVLYDIADSVKNGRPISLTVPSFNCVWQGYANEIAIRGLLHKGIFNISGPEIGNVYKTAVKYGEMFGIEPKFSTNEGEKALLVDTTKAVELFGYPDVPLKTLTEWQGQWILDGGIGLGKPTHFEESKGNY